MKITAHTLSLGYQPHYQSRSQHSEQQFMAEQNRGPVDVLSLSLAAALAYFFLIVWWRRHKRMKAESLPQARALLNTPSDTQSDLE